jgi:hypothetical protein
MARFLKKLGVKDMRVIALSREEALSLVHDLTTMLVVGYGSAPSVFIHDGKAVRLLFQVDPPQTAPESEIRDLLGSNEG